MCCCFFFYLSFASWFFIRVFTNKRARLAQFLAGHLNPFSTFCTYNFPVYRTFFLLFFIRVEIYDRSTLSKVNFVTKNKRWTFVDAQPERRGDLEQFSLRV